MSRLEQMEKKLEDMGEVLVEINTAEEYEVESDEESEESDDGSYTETSASSVPTSPQSCPF